MQQEHILRHQLAILRRFSLPIVAVVVLAALFAYLGSGLLPRTYESRATLLVGQALAPTAPDFDQLLASQRLSQTYARMATMRPMVQQVIDRLDLPETPEQLDQKVSALAASDDLFLTIRVEDSDATRAATIANAFADALVESSPDVLLAPPEVGGANLLSLVEPAVPAAGPIAPRTLMNTLLATVVALMVTVGLTFVLAYLDDRLRSPKDLTDAAPDLPIIGIIERPGEILPATGPPAIAQRPYSAEADAYREMRTQLGFTHPGTDLRSMLITGVADDGLAAEVAANLSLAFAHASHRTVLVDADLRHPTIHQIFGGSNDSGLSNLLMAPGTDPLSLSHVSLDAHLRIITAGPTPSSPAETFAPARIGQLMGALRDECDVAIVYAPYVFEAGETANLAGAIDGAVIVVDGDHTTVRDLNRIRANLERAGGRLIGVAFVRSVEPSRGVRGRFKALQSSPGPREST